MSEFPLAFEALTLSRRPNQFLMLPDGFKALAAAHAVSPVLPSAPAKVYETIKRVFSAEPRVVLAREDAEAGQLEFVQRSPIFRFPDTITIAVVPAGKDKSALAIYSRAKIGYRDFGVNKKRIEHWLDLLQAAIKSK